MTSMQYGQYRQASARALELSVRLGDQPAIVRVDSPATIDAMLVSWIIDEAICAESYEDFRDALAGRQLVVTATVQGSTAEKN